MVIQDNRSKTSSNTELSDFYEIRGSMRYEGHTAYTVGLLSDKDNEPFLTGLVSGGADQSGWRILPHVKLANLPSYDANGKLTFSAIPELGDDPGSKGNQLPRIDHKAAGNFLQRYGILHEGDAVHLTTGERFKEALRTDGCSSQEVDFLTNTSAVHGACDHCAAYRLPLGIFSQAQNRLRLAWNGDLQVIHEHFEPEVVEAFELRSYQLRSGSRRRGTSVELVAEDLWAFICLLLLTDFVRYRTGFCANPECLAPYYVKKRRSQKLCESGACTQWAQRQYANKWWREQGANRRKDKRKPQKQKAKIRISV